METSHMTYSIGSPFGSQLYENCVLYCVNCTVIQMFFILSANKNFNQSINETISPQRRFMYEKYLRCDS